MLAAFRMRMIYMPFASHFTNPTPEAIAEHMKIASNHFNTPGFILTSTPNFLPLILQSYEFLIEDFKCPQNESRLSMS
jgi:hypothetical protein